MAEYVYGGKNVLFWITQLATFAILILAANTAYQGFPVLSSIIAHDGYLPRQLANRGDKLVFSNGIIFLAVAAGVLIIVFSGNISALIPLYAFGVFTGFTLSQAGHGRPPPPRARSRGGRPPLAINAVGCVATGTVALVVVVSKFTEGAWIPAVADPGPRPRLPGDRNATTRTSAPPSTVEPGFKAPAARPTSSSCSSGRCTAASSRPCSTPGRWRRSGSSPCPS